MPCTDSTHRQLMMVSVCARPYFVPSKLTLIILLVYGKRIVYSLWVIVHSHLEMGDHSVYVCLYSFYRFKHHIIAFNLLHTMRTGFFTYLDPYKPGAVCIEHLKSIRLLIQVPLSCNLIHSDLKCKIRAPTLRRLIQNGHRCLMTCTIMFIKAQNMVIW